MAGERDVEPAPWQRAAGRSDGGRYGGRAPDRDSEYGYDDAQRGVPGPRRGRPQPAWEEEDGYAAPPAPSGRGRSDSRGARSAAPVPAPSYGRDDRDSRSGRGSRDSRDNWSPRDEYEDEEEVGGGSRSRGGGGGRGGSRGTRVPGPRFGPKAIVTVSAASLFATVAGSAAFAYQHYNGAINTAADGGLTKNRPAAAQANSKGQVPENILLVGSDSRDNGNNQYGGGKTGQGARSDTSILLHIYADHQHAVGISIPRDMMVDIPACLYDQTKPDGKKSAPQHNQFNAAFAVGDTSQGNIICERDTIEQMSGIRIDHTVVVGFAAFANLTTDIGGVQVCVPQTVSDVNGDNITLKKGIQVVEGKTALDYVREREGLGDGSDIGRTRRQQAFLGSMIKKIETSGVLNDPTTVSQLVNDAMKNAVFDKDLGSISALTDFAMSLKGVNPANIQFMTLPGHYSGARVEMDPVSAGVIWDHLKNDVRLDGTNAAGNSGAAAAATATASAPTSAPTTTAAPSIAPSTISVLVRNGTSVTGLAGNATTSMSAQGYNAQVSRVNTPDTPVTTIVYGTSKQKEWADQLAATLFPGAKVESGGHGTQVVVTLGADYAAAHPQPGSSIANATSGSSASAGGGGTDASGQPLPTAIANNSRTAADDICSGITQGFGAGTG